MPEENINPSIREANKTLRVLKGEKLKFTITVYMKSGNVYEYQSNEMPKIDFDSKAREPFLTDHGYKDSPVAQMSQVELIHCEDNPV